MIEAQIYKALGDPIRLEMVKRLAMSSPSSIGELSADLAVTRQGARKQLQVLVNANLVQLQQQGRQTLVTLDRQTLDVARAFIAQLEQQWDERLAALKDLVEGEG